MINYLKKKIRDWLVKEEQLPESHFIVAIDDIRNKRSQEIARLYKDGVSLEEIAKRVGMPRGSLYYTLNKLNLVGKRGNIRQKKFNSVQKRALKLYKQGVKVRDIIKQIPHGNNNHIYKHLKKIKKRCNKRTYRRLSPQGRIERDTNIIRMYKNGESIASIGKKAGVHPASMYKILRMYKIKVDRNRNYEK